MDSFPGGNISVHFSEIICRIFPAGWPKHFMALALLFCACNLQGLLGLKTGKMKHQFFRMFFLFFSKAECEVRKWVGISLRHLTAENLKTHLEISEAT